MDELNPFMSSAPEGLADFASPPPSRSKAAWKPSFAPDNFHGAASPSDADMSVPTPTSITGAMGTPTTKRSRQQLDISDAAADAYAAASGAAAGAGAAAGSATSAGGAHMTLPAVGHPMRGAAASSTPPARKHVPDASTCAASGCTESVDLFRCACGLRSLCGDHLESAGFRTCSYEDCEYGLLCPDCKVTTCVSCKMVHCAGRMDHGQVCRGPGHRMRAVCADCYQDLDIRGCTKCGRGAGCELCAKAAATCAGLCGAELCAACTSRCTTCDGAYCSACVIAQEHGGGASGGSSSTRGLMCLSCRHPADHVAAHPREWTAL